MDPRSMEPSYEHPRPISPYDRSSRALGHGAPRRRRSRVRTRRWGGTRPRRRHAVDGPWNIHGDHGAVGLREVDAAADRGGPGPPDAGRRPPRRGAAQRSQRAGARPAAPRADRLHLPVLQSARRADRRAERRTAVAACGQAAASVGRSRCPGGRRAGGARARVGLEGRGAPRRAQLSGGQQQRVSIARALVGEPSVMFADEPTGALDTRAGRAVLALLRETIDETGGTLVMVTHDPSAAAWADRVVFMADGRLAGELQAPTAEQVAERLTGLGA